jgi:hypothetical protein
MTRNRWALLGCAAVYAQNIGTDVSTLKRFKQGIFTCIKGDAADLCFGNFADPAVDEEAHNPLNSDTTCRNWCTDSPCLGLLGNRTQECGACNSQAKCNPTAIDWEKHAPDDAAPATCMEHCNVNGCNQLTGDPAFECAGCDDTNNCHPGAAHFSDWLERNKQRTEL